MAEKPTSKVPETWLPQATPADMERVNWESERIANTRALEEIDKLSPDLKAIADKYTKGFSPVRTLEEVRAQEKINSLPNSLKEIATKLIWIWYYPTNALKINDVKTELIDKLPDKSKDISYKYMWLWYSPIDAYIEWHCQLFINIIQPEEVRERAKELLRQWNSPSKTLELL